MNHIRFAIVALFIAILLSKTASAEMDSATAGFTASTKDGITSTAEGTPGPASRHGGYIQGDAHYAELRSLDDVVGGRFGFGFQARFGLKAGLEMHGGVVDAMSVCLPPNVAGPDLVDCVLADKAMAAYFGLGPALGYDFRLLGGMGVEVSARFNYLAHGNTQGYSVSGGPSLYYNFDALSDGAVPVYVRAGVEYGRYEYKLHGVDLSANTFTFLGGIGVRL